MRHQHTITFLTATSLTAALSLAGATPALADPVAPYTGGSPGMLLWPWVLGACVLVAAGLFLVFWYRRRPDDEPPAVDGNDWSGEDPAYPPSGPAPQAPDASDKTPPDPATAAPANNGYHSVFSDVAAPSRPHAAHSADSLADFGSPRPSSLRPSSLKLSSPPESSLLASPLLESSLPEASLPVSPLLESPLPESSLPVSTPSVAVRPDTSAFAYRRSRVQPVEPELFLAVTPPRHPAARAASTPEPAGDATRAVPESVTVDEVGIAHASVTVGQPSAEAGGLVAAAVIERATRGEPELEDAATPRRLAHSRFRR